MTPTPDLVRVALVGGPLDGEERVVRLNVRVKTFVVPVENGATGPLGFPLVIGHDYAVDADGVWRYVAPPYGPHAEAA